ncbi:MAG: HAD-IA family hydrolase [Verrucomicrobiales bacterium]|nr:HAD-IA family hydrolase [Verrucomicrobiales bacterium]
MQSPELFTGDSRFEVVSFDCYGTLIDWESGILGALRPILTRHGAAATDAHLLRLYSEIEPELQRGPFRSYRTILRETVVAFGSRLGFHPSQSERDALADSLPEWRPFPDTVPALRRLATRFRLGVLSNIDDDLFAATARRLQVEFEFIVTASAVGSYKPDPGHFIELLRRTGLPPARHLHAAESLFHDIAPANALGLISVWVRRSHDRQEFSASRRIPVVPAADVPDMAELARRLAPESPPLSMLP